MEADQALLRGRPDRVSIRCGVGLAALLATFVLWAGITEPVYLRVATCPRPQLACTYPADSRLEGPTGSAVVVLTPKLLRMEPGMQARALAHEIGHVREDLDLLRQGKRVSCKRAQKWERELLGRLRK